MRREDILAILLGFVSLLSQLLLIRELLTTFSGNELIIGLIIALWLASTGAGSFFARKLKTSNDRVIAGALLLSVMLLPLEFFLIRIGHGYFMTAGMPSLDTILVFILIIVFPLTFVFGGTFTLLSNLINRSSEVTTIYIFECAGAVLGSFFYIVVQLANLNSFLSATFMLILTSTFLLPIYRKHIKITGLIVLLILFSFFFPGLNALSFKFSYPGQSTIYEKQTPYGTIILTTQGEQLNLYENGFPLSSSNDPIAREELAHFVMSQRPEAKRVLVIGGGFTGVTEEIKKYSPTVIEYIDIDPEMVRVSSRYFGTLRDGVTVHLSDLREFLRKENKYDVIILNTPDPINGTLNRYYTLEFFRNVKARLSPAGVFGFSLTGSETYLGREMRKLHASVYKALNGVFKEILILPGGRTFYLASDHPLTDRILERLNSLKVKTQYANEGYLKSRLTEERLKNARTWVLTEAEQNTDFEPAAYRYYINVWLSQFTEKFPLTLFLGITLLIFIISVITKSKIKVLSLVSLTTGYCGISIELSLLFLFQVIYSTLYLDIGLLFVAFMIGMAVGGILSKRFLSSELNYLILIETLNLIFPFLIIVGFVCFDLRSLSIPSARLFFSSLLLLGGFLSGAEFALLFPSASVKPTESASAIYSTDLLGSCAGAFITGILAIPLLGIQKSILLISIVKFSSWLPLIIYLKNPAMKIPYREWYIWVLMFISFVILGLLIVNNRTNQVIYAFSKSWFQSFLFISSMIIALIITSGLIKPVFSAGLKIFQFLAISLIAFYPVFRCFFLIPYLFCHVCPRQCSFGIFRKYIVLTSTVTNAGNWPFCHMTCPIGIMYNAQPISERRVTTTTLKKLHILRSVILLLIPVVYLKSKLDAQALISPFLDIYNFMFKNSYRPSIMVIAIATVFILGGFVVPRLFCHIFCPIGAVADIVKGVKKRE